MRAISSPPKLTNRWSSAREGGVSMQSRARAVVLTAVTGLVASTGVALATPSAHAAAGKAALPVQCSGTSPVRCHYDVAPGNYTITVLLGDAASAANTSMWVEARRLIVPTVTTAAGTVTRYSATVNVREPEGQPT